MLGPQGITSLCDGGDSKELFTPLLETVQKEGSVVVFIYFFLAQEASAVSIAIVSVWGQVLQRDCSQKPALLLVHMVDVQPFLHAYSC